MDESIITVTELTDLIKNVLSKEIPKKLSVIGEISNFKLSKANVYFTIKDENASINAVIWNYTSRKPTINLKDGHKVQATGQINLFAKSGSYNLTVYKIELLGTGDLHQDYLTTKEQYENLGYFDKEIKKQLPDNIQSIGVLTAVDGAALQDFLYVINKNNYCGKVIVKNCAVQGKDCPNSVAEGLQILDKLNLDVIVVMRGGGSFEDLFGFSHPVVIEAMHILDTCVISAIGHEVDNMLSDFVADIRAPTPSIAGEIVTSANKDKYNIVKYELMISKISNMIDTKFNNYDNSLYVLLNKLKNPYEVIEQTINNNNLIIQKLNNMINLQLMTQYKGLLDIKTKFNSFDSIKSLNNGFCIALDKNNKKINNVIEFEYSKIGQLRNKKLKIKFIDGEVLIDIKAITIVKN